MISAMHTQGLTFLKCIALVIPPINVTSPLEVSLQRLGSLIVNHES